MPSRPISIFSLVTLLLCACASHQAQLAVFSQAADSSEPAPVTEPVPGSPEPPAPTQLAAAEAVQGILVSGLIQHPPVEGETQPHENDQHAAQEAYGPGKSGNDACERFADSTGQEAEDE